MQLTPRLPKRRAARPAEPASPSAETTAAPAAPAPRRAAGRGGGPQDQALYACMCGYAFTATVTTSVDCPHCGVEQAW